MDTDTITAISTPMGEGAIAIVRLSGPHSIDIADQLYKGKKSLKEVDSHTIHYGKIIDDSTGDVVEEAMVSVLKGPKTFTRENIVEINCHGGLVSVNRVLELALNHGARLAEPGEFTKRAFLNGRIDLSQAEAVMDLIRAKTDQAMNVAMGQMEGRLSKLVGNLRQTLLEIIAQVEVHIDYPEYDAEEMTNNLLLDKAQMVHDKIEELLITAKQGKILREGLSTVIIGRPNVGKSSLLNSLVHENKAIVTDIPGTTRDVIEEYVNIRGVPLKLVDTAGIRDTEDIIERIGVERSRKVLKEADLILLLLNYHEALTLGDRQLFEAIKGMDAVIIVNKTDLNRQIDLDEVKALAGHHPIMTTSLLKDEGINDLEQAIAFLFFNQGIETQDATYVSNTRHISLLTQAKGTITEAMNSIQDGVPVDMAQIDVRRTWEILGEIVGDTVSDSLINQLFSQFCLGK